MLGLNQEQRALYWTRQRWQLKRCRRCDAEFSGRQCNGCKTRLQRERRAREALVCYWREVGLPLETNQRPGSALPVKDGQEPTPSYTTVGDMKTPRSADFPRQAVRGAQEFCSAL